MKRWLLCLLAACLLWVAPLGGVAQVGAPVNTIPGSVWTYLGPTYGASWVFPPSGSFGWVPNNAALVALVTSLTQVFRAGFYAPGDGGAMIYTHTAAACSLNGGVGDDGWQVKAIDGGCWVAEFGTRRVAVEVWGCKGDGTTDAAACLTKAAGGFGGSGGGELVAAGRYLVSSADVQVAPKVTLTGTWPRPGLVPGANYTAVQSALVVNSARTIRVLSGGGLEHIIVVRQGVLNPGAAGQTTAQTLQTSYAQHAAFAGTGVTLGSGTSNGSTSLVRDILVIGFNRCLDGTDTNLYQITGVYGDCENGLRLRQVGELGTVAHNHFWPFMVYGGPDGKYENGAAGSDTYFYSAAITGVSNAGGLIRLTFGAGHAFETGNTIVVQGTPANTNADNSDDDTFAAHPLWTVTKVSGTQVDLQGSTFANSAGAGGKAYASVVYREGDGFALGSSGGLGCDHCSLVDNRAFGFKNGFHVTDSAHVRLLGNRSDTWFQPLRRETRGLLVDGIADAFTASDMTIAAAGTLIEYGSTGGVMGGLGSMSNVNLWGCGWNSIVVNSASLSVAGGFVDATPPAQQTIGNCRAVANGGQLYLTGGLQFFNNGIIEQGGEITVGDVVDQQNRMYGVSTNLQHFTFYVQGKPPTLLPEAYVFGRPGSSYLNMQSSYCKAGTAPTANAVFQLKRNGANIGTATFAAGQVFATFSVPAGDWATGEVFTTSGPLVEDATLSDVACNFAFGMR